MLPPVVKKLCGRIFICVKNCKHFKTNVPVQNYFDETTNSLAFCKDICLRKLIGCKDAKTEEQITITSKNISRKQFVVQIWDEIR